MQCHGGLKAPLRRIIRSLGNDSVGSSCRSYPQRHLSTPERYSPSPPKRCNPSQDLRPKRKAPISSSRQPGAPHAPRDCSFRCYSTQCSPHDSRSEPEPQESGHDDRQSNRLEPIGTVPYGSNTIVSPRGSALKYNETSDPRLNRVVVRRCLTEAPVKDGNDFSDRYKARYRRASVAQMRSQFVAHEMRQERHGYGSSNDWRVVLRMLDDNTTAGPELYEKRLETVMLPKGVLATFDCNAGVSLREIMEQSGCHVQVAGGAPPDSQNVDAFEGLDLLGSSNQIAHALKILPQYIDVMPAEEMVGRQGLSNSNDHFLEHSVKSENDMKLASRTTPSTEAHREYSLDESILGDGADQDEVKSTSTWKPPIRSVWTESRTRVYSMSNALDERSRSMSSPLEISAYVADLCQSVPRVVKRTMSFSPGGDVQVVTEKLVSLFARSEIPKLATSDTVNRAISYLTRHNNFAAFRELYKALEDGGYVFNASNWNCCLAAAAKAGDMHNYQYTLKVMLRHGLKPNPVTWTTFHDLMCRRFPRESSFVANIMRDKGMLVDHQAAKLVSQNAVANDLKAHLAQRGSLRQFFRLYDNRFNSTYGLEDFTWLNVDVVNRMCAVLFSLGRSHNAFEVVREFHKRNGERALDVATLNTFLTSSLRDMDPKSAVAMLQHFNVGKPGAIVPNSGTYATLFSIAWHRHYFNMLRVIWRYACTSGHVGYGMRFRFHKNLKVFTSKELVDDLDKSRGDVWHAFAAKFSIGITGGLGDLKNKDKVVPEEVHLNMLETQILHHESLGSLPFDSPHYEERREFFRKVFTDDIGEVSSSRPVIPFAELLKAAWEKDREWKERGLGLPKRYGKGTFREMLEDGIKVPMKAGLGTLEIRAWEVPSSLRRNLSTERKYDDDDGESHA